MSISLNHAINLREKPHLAICAHNVHHGFDRFLLTDHWSLHIYQYHARVLIADSTFDIVPGSMTLVPPGTVSEYHYYGPSHHIFAHFSLPEMPPNTNGLLLPVFYDLRNDFWRFEQGMETMAESSLVNLLRAEIKLWDLLWELAKYGQNTTVQQHPSLEKALVLIEARLGDNISIPALAHAVGISHNQLTRLFQQTTGGTVVAYIRSKRAERAKHLLTYTTLPLKVIAAQVNAADLQSFSSLLKKETGHAPTYWRRQGRLS